MQEPVAAHGFQDKTMGKIHTHYDNLKVARLAPQEVIRAAYKALSQKYHPDKNPGDEKAARIMAILNSAYGTLSDPQRRREHDEWIAAEEWEIEWLESTQHEDKDARHKDGKPKEGRQSGAQEHAWAQDVPRPAARRSVPLWRSWIWWFSLILCLLLGWLGAWLLQSGNSAVPAALESAWSGLARDGATAGHNAPLPKSEPVAVDSWTVGKPYVPEPSPAKVDIKVLAVSQLQLKASSAPCENSSQSLLAPNGEAWPVQSGYVEGFPVSNKGSDMAITLDNSANATPVFVRLYDLERRANVRYVYVLAHDKLTVEQLGTGKYEVRYQSIEPGSESCGSKSSGSIEAAPASEGNAQNPVVSNI